MTTPVPYTTANLVRNLISRETASRPGTGASIDDAQINEAISAAQQKIDSVLGVVYPVPFVGEIPPLIVDAATAIAALEVDLTFRETRDYQTELNPVVLRAKRYEDLLVQIRKGDAIIPGYTPPGEAPDNPSDGGSVVGVENPCLVDLSCRPQPSWHDRYYGIVP